MEELEKTVNIIQSELKKLRRNIEEFDISRFLEDRSKALPERN